MLPRIIWVASRPPIPPWTGVLLTTLSGLSAVASATDVQVISFANDIERDVIITKFEKYWQGQRVKLCLLPYSKQASIPRAILAKKFQFGSMVEGLPIRKALKEAGANESNCLVVFDDIVFAPLLPEFGQNAILSPHDCMSEMFLSHFRTLPLGLSAIKCFIEYLIALHYEKHFYHMALLTHLVTHRDRVNLEAINHKARYQVFSYGDWASLNTNQTTDQLWDVLIWADISNEALAQNTRDFLLLAKASTEWWRQHKVIVVGRISEAQAVQAFGKELLSEIEYASYLDDNDGRIKQAKIILIPDKGGAGIKSRCLSVLAAGQCLACLYIQMEGLEKISDRGAVNASNTMELFNRIKYVLDQGTFQEIARIGAAIFRKNYSREIVQAGWLEMIERAVIIREYLNFSR